MAVSQGIEMYKRKHNVHSRLCADQLSFGLDAVAFVCPCRGAFPVSKRTRFVWDIDLRGVALFDIQ